MGTGVLKELFCYWNGNFAIKSNKSPKTSEHNNEKHVFVIAAGMLASARTAEMGVAAMEVMLRCNRFQSDENT